MKNKLFKGCFLTFFLCAMILDVFAISCDNCSDCNVKVGAGGTVTMSDNFDFTGTCINNFTNSVILDCNNKYMSGDGTTGSAVHVINKIGVTIKNCAIYDTRYGINFINSSDGNILNNYVNNIYYDGIYIHGDSDNNYIYNNDVYHCGHGGITLCGEGNIIESNIVNSNVHCGVCFGCASGSDLTINSIVKNNYVRFNGWQGVLVSNYSDNTVIYGNRINNNNKSGLTVVNSDNLNIELNFIYDNAFYGVSFENNSNSKIVNNYIFINDYHGFYIYDNDNNNNFSDNVIQSNKWDGVFLSSISFNNIVNSNIICGNNRAGGYYDIENKGSNNIGDNNKCTDYKNWNDTGTVGCTYLCNGEGEGECVCSSCEECETLIDISECTYINLISDIQQNLSQSEGCITTTDKTNKIFDCNNHYIYSNNSFFSYGYFLGETDNITIKNCEFKHFYRDIYIHNSTNIILINNTLCNSESVDILNDEYSSDNVGYNNTCEHTLNWNDEGVYIDCNYVCESLACECVNCSDCEDKLNSVECNKVKLINNINTNSNYCIDGTQLNNFNNKIFDCNNYEITGNNAGIGINLFTNNFGVSITNCRIKNFNTAIKIKFTDLNNFINNIIYDNVYSIYNSGSNNNLFNNNQIYNNDYGILIYNSNNLNIINNNIYNNLNYAIKFYDNNNNNIFNSNIISENDGGIYLSSNTYDTNFNYNIICKNSILSEKNDIHNKGINNIGYLNTCDFTYNYYDEGNPAGCFYKCSGNYTPPPENLTEEQQNYLNQTDVFESIKNIQNITGFTGDSGNILFVILIQIILSVYMIIKNMEWTVLIFINLLILIGFVIIGYIPFWFILILMIIAAIIFALVLKKSIT